MAALMRRRFLSHHQQQQLIRLSCGCYRTATAKDTGLYGFDHLKTPQGFTRFIDDAIQRSNDLINNISLKPSSAEVIRAMDGILGAVCSADVSARLCRRTHPDREFVEEAEKASTRIRQYMDSIFENYTLYDAVKRAEKDSHLSNSEAQRAATMFAIDFEKCDIHLSRDKLDRLSRLDQTDYHLTQGVYPKNITNDPGHVDVYPASRVSKSLHDILKPIFRSPSSNQEIKEKGYRIVTDPDILLYVLDLESDSEIRKLAYIEGNSGPSLNVGVLEKLISTRHKIAQIRGFKSYAEFMHHQNMATSPGAVMPNLLEMSEMVRPMADKEFERILDFKRQRSGQINCDLEPWDKTYFTGLMESSLYDLDSSVVASYFPLSQCVEGLKLLVESLFGLTLKSMPLAPGESWHRDVLKMSLFHPDEGDLGYLYLDLNPRSGKYPGCAHFPIRRRQCIAETEYQLPVVALVCNFGDSAAVKLDHEDVETLFQEFGYALHLLLSQSDYQHFLGIEMALGLEDTPSNLFKYYASDYHVLKTFARHYSTGETIPEKLVESMQGARKMFSATKLQRQIIDALIFQTLFGEQTAAPMDTVSIVRDLERRHSSWKHVEGTHRHTRFPLLLTDGAEFYSDLYPQCLASAIWHKICKEDPLSLATGTAIRTKILQHSGAKDPATLLIDLAGDGIVKCCNGGMVPDMTCLYDGMNIFDYSL